MAIAFVNTVCCACASRCAHVSWVWLADNEQSQVRMSFAYCACSSLLFTAHGTSICPVRHAALLIASLSWQLFSLTGSSGVLVIMVWHVHTPPHQCQQVRLQAHVQVDSTLTSPRSQHAPSDMDLDTAPVFGAAPVNMPPVADTADMQPDSAMHSIAPSQAMQHVSHQHHHQPQQQQQQNGKHTPLSSHAAMQPLYDVHHTASSHNRAADRLTPQQPSPMASQGLSRGHGTTRGTTHGATQATGNRQGMRQSPRHGHVDGDEEQQGAVMLQHASSTSAMMSLAQQASQSSWHSHQQPVKRHSRHTGQL